MSLLPLGCLSWFSLIDLGYFIAIVRLPRWHCGKELACQCKRHKRPGFGSWVGKIPWRRKWQPTPVFLPGKSHGQRNLAGYSPWGHKESDTTERLNWLTLTPLSENYCLFPGSPRRGWSSRFLGSSGGLWPSKDTEAHPCTGFIKPGLDWSLHPTPASIKSTAPPTEAHRFR